VSNGNVNAPSGGGAGGTVSAVGGALSSIIGGAFGTAAEVAGRQAEAEMLAEQAAYGFQTILEDIEAQRRAGERTAEQEAALRQAEQEARAGLEAIRAEAAQAERQRATAARRAAREAALAAQARRINIPTWAWALIAVGGIGTTFGVVAWLAKRKG
jgi:hypothetical protein